MNSNSNILIIPASQRLLEALEELLTTKLPAMLKSEAKEANVQPTVGAICPVCQKGNIRLSKYKQGNYYCSNYKEGCTWRHNI